MDRNGAANDGADQPVMRRRVSLVFSYFEDVVYVGLGLLLAYSAAALLVTAVMALVRSAAQGAPVPAIIDLLDRSLLVLMIVELLYTVKVSFREHALLPEPFLVVGLIAATRRILVVTAEFGQMVDKPDATFQKAMIEVALLTAMVLALVASLRLLRAHEKEPAPK
jgi:uncharacterized membrane protein (DUF373 family)